MKKRQKHYLFIFITLFSALFIHSQNAAAETPKDTAARLQNRYDNLKSLTFDFIQETRGQMTGRPKTGRGKAYFARNSVPGKMRWNYSDPDKQILVSDGKNFLMYFESLKQMIVTPAKNLQQDLTYSFFTGTGNLLEDFTVVEAASEQDNVQKETSVIKLVPKDTQTQVASIQLWVTADSLIRRIEILDQFDTTTVLNFSTLQADSLDISNQAMMQELFNFTPPEGTEIIHQ